MTHILAERIRIRIQPSRPAGWNLQHFFYLFSFLFWALSDDLDKTWKWTNNCGMPLSLPQGRALRWRRKSDIQLSDELLNALTDTHDGLLTWLFFLNRHRSKFKLGTTKKKNEDSKKKVLTTCYHRDPVIPRSWDHSAVLYVCASSQP